MGEWREFRLADFAIINPSESIPKGTVSKKIPMEALQPFTKRVPYFSFDKFNGGVKFRNGDTLVARITPSLENGKTSYVDILNDNEVGFGSTEFIILREIEGISDKHFIYYLAVSPTIRHIAIKSMTGSSGRQRVQTDVVREHSFDAPPLPEQRAIAEVLSSLDDKIDLLHRQNQTLEQMAEALFRQWFVEEADEGWEETTVSAFAEHLKISVNPSKNPNLEYAHYSIPAFDSGKEPSIELGHEIQSNKYAVLTDTILFSKLNPHKDKRVWLLTDFVPANSVCSTEFQVLKPKLKHYLYFLYGWLTNSVNYREIASGAGGTSGSHQRISPNEIFGFPAPVIPETILEAYSDTARPIFSKQQANQTQIRTLTSLRDTLLPKLMSGEVRVELS